MLLDSSGAPYMGGSCTSLSDEKRERVCRRGDLLLAERAIAEINLLLV